MPQSLARAIMHLVFATRDRRCAFRLERMRTDTAAYIAGILNHLDCAAIAIGVAADHVHILHLLSRTRTIADVAGTVKRESSEWIKQQPWALGNVDFADFHWQTGYGVFSVSESRVEAVTTYIDQQMDHHRQMTFQDEYRTFLQRHRIEYDEQYLWD